MTGLLITIKLTEPSKTRLTFFICSFRNAIGSSGLFSRTLRQRKENSAFVLIICRHVIFDVPRVA